MKNMDSDKKPDKITPCCALCGKAASLETEATISNGFQTIYLCEEHNQAFYQALFDQE